MQKRQPQTKYYSVELNINDFYCVFVCTEMNLIAFLDSSYWVNTQNAALSGAMH